MERGRAARAARATSGEHGRGSRRIQGRTWRLDSQREVPETSPISSKSGGWAENIRQTSYFGVGHRKKNLFVPRSRAATIRTVVVLTKALEEEYLRRAWSILSQPIHHFVSV